MKWESGVWRVGRVEQCAVGHALQRWPRSWAAALDRSVEMAGDMGVRGKKAEKTLELSQATLPCKVVLPPCSAVP